MAISLIWLAMAMNAATIWNGPLILYSQPTPDPTQVSNQDHLTPDVWLTRATSKGLFNAFLETNATSLSPSNTEWAAGTLSNYATLHYTNWLAWLNGQSPTNLVGKNSMVHLISDDVYVFVQFTTWGSGGSGGFAYERSTPAPALISGMTASNGYVAFNYSTAPGYTYVVQSSTNLVEWLPISTNEAPGDSLSFTNSPASEAGEFYRVARMAGP